eukprot:1195274-Prorocentrum_minimum.AAC.7
MVKNQSQGTREHIPGVGTDRRGLDTTYSRQLSRLLGWVEPIFRVVPVKHVYYGRAEGRRGGGAEGRRGLPSTSLVTRSHTTISRLASAEAIMDPSGEYSTHVTAPRCLSKVAHSRSAPPSTAYTCTCEMFHTQTP